MFMTLQSWALLIYYIYNICCWSGKGPRSGGELLTTTLLSCSDLTYGYENSYSEQFWLYPYLINGKVLALGSIWDITHWLLLFPPLVPSNPTSPNHHSMEWQTRAWPLQSQTRTYQGTMSPSGEFILGKIRLGSNPTQPTFPREG